MGRLGGLSEHLAEAFRNSYLTPMAFAVAEEEDRTTRLAEAVENTSFVDEEEDPEEGTAYAVVGAQTVQLYNTQDAEVELQDANTADVVEAEVMPRWAHIVRSGVAFEVLDLRSRNLEHSRLLKYRSCHIYPSTASSSKGTEDDVSIDVASECQRLFVYALGHRGCSTQLTLECGVWGS